MIHFLCSHLCLGPEQLQDISMPEAILVDKKFQTWLLIGWQHSQVPAILKAMLEIVVNQHGYNMDPT